MNYNTELIPPIHKAVKYSGGWAEISATLRHKSEDKPLQSAAFCGIISEPLITYRHMEKLEDEKNPYVQPDISQRQTEHGEETSVTGTTELKFVLVHEGWPV